MAKRKVTLEHSVMEPIGPCYVAGSGRYVWVHLWFSSRRGKRWAVAEYEAPFEGKLELFAAGTVLARTA